MPHYRYGKKVRLLLTLITMESWLSGRKRHPAKVLSSAMGSAGSNPALSVPLNSKENISERENLEQIRWKQIVESNIDFSKFGWVKELSELWHIASNKAGKYVRKHYSDFYKEKCFQRI